MGPLDELIGLQAGVVSRRQVLGTGEDAHDIRRRLRRREWARVHDGVYVDHTGALSWTQRAWAAVLFAWPASLCHGSALRVLDAPARREADDGGPIHVAVDRDRGVRAPSGLVVHRMVELETRVHWNMSPPRVRVEEAALDLAAEAATEFDAISVLADVAQARRTTADRLLAALERRSRIARRAFLEAVLHDVGAGALSALEHA